MSAEERWGRAQYAIRIDMAKAFAARRPVSRHNRGQRARYAARAA